MGGERAVPDGLNSFYHKEHVTIWYSKNSKMAGHTVFVTLLFSSNLLCSPSSSPPLQVNSQICSRVWILLRRARHTQVSGSGRFPIHACLLRQCGASTKGPASLKRQDSVQVDQRPGGTWLSPYSSTTYCSLPFRPPISSHHWPSFGAVAWDKEHK